jgi:transcriptional regulator CtsR
MPDHPHRFGRAPLLPVVLSVVAAFSASSCSTTSGRKPSGGAEASARQSDQRDATIRELKQATDQQIAHLAEKDALIKQLEQSLLSQQQMLDDAMQEVVRVQAKQRSLESRAEAASEMAEAEIGLQSLREKAADTNPPEMANAEQLLTRATGEFDKQNFGGALYLVGQAKRQIKLGELRLGEQHRVDERVAEMPFVVPLSLTLSARGNLREGPGQEFKILVTLDPGTRITAYFTRGQWMRVESDGGGSGWIHRSLVSPN